MFDIFTNAILSFIGGLFSFILLPIFNAIGTVFPDFNSFSTYIIDFLNVAASSIGWVINCLGLDIAIRLYLTIFGLVLVISGPVWFIKIVLRWYRILMP